MERCAFQRNGPLDISCNARSASVEHCPGWCAGFAKNGNNGAVSCSTYCKGNWAGCSGGSCVAAVDNSTRPSSSIGCDTVRGAKTAQVTCFCTGCTGAHAHMAVDCGCQSRS